MRKAKDFPVVVATDGSAHARAAIETALVFPWPRRSRAHGVVARGLPLVTAEWSPAVWAALEERMERVAEEARRALRRRWADADVVVLDKPPVDAILAESRGAGAVVVGSHGHGAVTRLLLGSVSRGVVRRAACPTLVVKARARRVTRFVVGIDGSAHARHAVAWLATLPAPRGNRVTVVRVVEPLRVGSTAVMPARVRGLLLRELGALNAERARVARRDVDAATAELRRHGWAARGMLRAGVPLEELLATAKAARPHAIVVGARGVGGVERLLLGSVAEGVLSRSPVSVLVVR